MAFTEIELAQIEEVVGTFCERRTPVEKRDKLRFEYSVRRHDVELVEVRPHWLNPGEEIRSGVAKFKFVRSANEWRLFWMRADLKWHSYEPLLSSRDLRELLAEVNEDPHACFFG